MARLLSSDGHEVYEAKDVEQAVNWATSEVIDVVVTDLRPPGTTAPELRRLVKRGLSPNAIPFVVLAADPEGEGPLLEELASGSHVLLLRRPVELHLLSWLVRSLAGNLQQLQGAFSDNSLHRLFEHIDGNADSGVLTAYRGTTVKKLVFVQGRLVFCSSGDSFERIGQWCIQAGLINEDELKEALKVQAHTVEPLLKILEELHKVGSEEAQELLHKKFREGALDLYLWDDGSWRYERGKVEVKHKLPNGIDARDLQVEGTRRAARWGELISMFPSFDERLDVIREAFPPQFPHNRADRRLIQLLQAGLTIRQVCDKFAGQHFGVLTRFAEFLEMGVVEVPPRPPMMDPYEEEGGSMVDSTLTLDPVSAPLPLADDDRPSGRVFATKLNLELSPDKEVWLTVPVKTLLDDSLKGYEAFVLSRLSGGQRMPVHQLLDDCPLSETQVMEILDRYIQRGVLALE